MVQSQAAPVTISALARAGGVGVETVRYYQRLNLLPTPERPAGDGLQGGVRRYRSEDLRRLRFIRSAQGAGFTLEQIRELIALDATADRTRARALAQEQITVLDARIAALATARAALSRLTHACGAGEEGPCPILETFDGRGAADVEHATPVTAEAPRGRGSRRTAARPRTPAGFGPGPG